MEGKEEGIKNVHSDNVKVIKGLFDSFTRSEALALKFI
jgi:hypothetical protein